MAQLHQRYRQNILYYREPEAEAVDEANDEAEAAFLMHSREPYSRKVKRVRLKPIDLWYRRMGYYGLTVLKELAK